MFGARGFRGAEGGLHGAPVLWEYWACLGKDEGIEETYKLVPGVQGWWWTLEKVWRSLETRKDLSAMEVVSKVYQCRMRLDLLWKEKACLGSSIDEAAGLLHSVFKEKPLLLNLEDVWKRIDISKLGICPPSNKIKIVLTSRDKEVCRSMKADKMIAMKQLSQEDGWELFCRGAFQAGEDQNMDSEIEPLARSIAKECKGHPLAIKTLAQTVPHLHNSSPSE
ncbi:hypothetical protein SUGI_0134030 [Cryptomeria japonica]|nr:hypothetical protein SUGI_0134030 [Cryptomeria japonica]